MRKIIVIGKTLMEFTQIATKKNTNVEKVFATQWQFLPDRFQKSNEPRDALVSGIIYLEDGR